MKNFAIISTVFASALVVSGGAFSAPEEKRFAQLDETTMTPAQQPVAAEVMKVSGIGIKGPYNVMLRSPEMAGRLLSLMNFLRFNTSVPTKLNEFAILIQARLWTSQVEWGAHYPIAMKAGLEPSVAADLKAGRRPEGMQPDEAVVYDMLMELANTQLLSDATFKRAKAIFSDQQIVDLIAVFGTYNTVAMMLETGKEVMPDGKTRIEPLKK